MCRKYVDDKKNTKRSPSQKINNLRAIGESALFSNPQRTNIELLQAYDKLLKDDQEPWTCVGHETKGHTRRVTELAVSLAQALGLGEKEINHIRRGALLHDLEK